MGERASFSRSELAKALDDHLPRMAFRQYGQFYNDDPDFDIEAYYERVADAIINAARQPAPSEGPQTPTGRWFRETYGARGYITSDDLKAKVRQLAHLTPEDWKERRGADPIARTINAVFDIIDEYSARQFAPSDGLRESFDSAIEWPTTRRLFLEGKTIISQTPTDPGDIGEPRLHIEDDTTYVSVPEFELWPTDPEWEPHDASIVYVTKRSFTLNAPGRITYHRPSRHTRYSDRTGCGIEIWSSGWEPGQQSSLIAVRRDVASRIARPCSICGTDR